MPVASRWRLCGCRWIVAVVALYGARAAALDVEVIPAWEGYYAPGEATELLVRVSSPVGGRLRLTAGDDAMTSVAQLNVQPDAVTVVALPVRPAAGSVTITAALGIAAATETLVNLLPLERPLRAVVIGLGTDLAAWLAEDDVSLPVPVAASALPQTAAGYAPVSQLVMAADVLTQASPEQRHALAQYLGGCGRLLLAATTPAVDAALRAQAGCSGRFVMTAASAATDATRASAAARPLPGARALQAMHAAAPRLWWLAVAFFAAYAAIMFVLGGGNHRRASVGMLLVPVLATGLLAATWSRGEPEFRFSLWLDQDSDSNIARFQALLDVYGQGTQAIEFVQPRELGLPVNLSPGPMEIEAVAGATNIRLQSLVLSRHSLSFSGAVEHLPMFSIAKGPDGLSVTYTGPGESPAATLAWDGRYFPLPTLRTAQSWQLDDAAATIPRERLPQALVAQGDGLLVALGSAASSASLAMLVGRSAAVWLMLRPPGTEHAS